MKTIILFASLLLAQNLYAQNLQLHYDFRHTLDPARNQSNFPSFSFEYFKELDTLHHGSFLFKMQADLKGSNHNMGQLFTQITQTLRFWKPKIYLSMNYSGGLGATPEGYGFYLNNTLGLGVSYPFQWKGAWLSASLVYRYNAFETASYDPQFTFYFGRGFLNYKIFVAGSFVAWTENKNQGNDYTAGLNGKKFAFFGDPQIWVKVAKQVSVGSRINVFYHLLGNDNAIQFYPTLGARYGF